MRTATRLSFIHSVAGGLLAAMAFHTIGAATETENFNMQVLPGPFAVR